MQKLIKNLNLIWNKFRKNNEEFWDEVEEQLILNDVGYETTSLIISEVKNATLGENINDINVIMTMLKKHVELMLKENSRYSGYQLAESIPTVWMLVGVNGVGKTSTIAKLAKFFKDKGREVLLTAADTYRAAAFEQIDHFARVLNLPIVHHQRFSDPGAVVYDSIEKAIAKKIDLVLIDTAGRMHTAYNLMEELKKIKKVINRKTNREPDEVLMVVDSTTGQNARQQVATFNDAVGLSGIILTKTDGTSKGGIVLTITNELKIPVKFITYGEKLDNIEVFDPQKFVDFLFS
jgi:fused signal recognition particle receptor